MFAARIPVNSALPLVTLISVMNGVWTNAAGGMRALKKSQSSPPQIGMSSGMGV